MTRNRLGLLVATLALAACGGDPSSRPGESEGLGEVTVFAASSLTESFTELGARLEADRPGTAVTFNFASSSDLALQIREGAPADVFASADLGQMEVVAHAGLAEDPARFATNELVVLVPADNPAAIEEVADVAGPGVKLVLAAPVVPAGNYARRAFEDLGILDAAEANVVSNEDDVKAVVTKIALGEADAGVAYATDATEEIATDVESVAFPPGAGTSAAYSFSALDQAPNPEGAAAFYEFVLSDEGRRVLADHGFGPP